MLKISELGIQPYQIIWEEMKQFTASRTPNTADEIWLLEHQPIYTQGQAGKSIHILNPGMIPVIQTDRGGQVTYHAPGQLIVYTMLDIRRSNLGIRTLVSQLEQIIIDLLHKFNITAIKHENAPGVYVGEKKIASIGLRVKNGCTYHGISLNVSLDLTPYLGINPCGFPQLEMTQLKDFVPNITVQEILPILKQMLRYQFEQIPQ